MTVPITLVVREKLHALLAAFSSTLSVIIDNWQEVEITGSKIKPLIHGYYFFFNGKTVVSTPHRSTFKRFKRQSCRLRLAV